MYERNWEMDIYEDQSQPMSHKVNISFKKNVLYIYIIGKGKRHCVAVCTHHEFIFRFVNSIEISVFHSFTGRKHTYVSKALGSVNIYSIVIIAV